MKANKIKKSNLRLWMERRLRMWLACRWSICTAQGLYSEMVKHPIRRWAIIHRILRKSFNECYQFDFIDDWIKGINQK